MGPSPRPDPTTELLALELALARRDIAALPGGLEAVFDPAFVEFGQSGRRWERSEMIDALTKVASTTGTADIDIERFAVERLADGVLLATYLLVGIRSEGETQASRRSSVWLRSEAGWRLRFHQGTTLRETD
jgi:hypothetical protein